MIPKLEMSPSLVLHDENPIKDFHIKILDDHKNN